MPKYSFKCNACGSEVQMYVPPLVKNVECKTCDGTMDRQMPNILNPNVTEVVDKYTGITHIDGQPEMIHDRKEEYYWSVEVPRLVNSGTYSIETMIENSWIWVDDAGKININTKPPSKR